MAARLSALTIPVEQRTAVEFRAVPGTDPGPDGAGRPDAGLPHPPDRLAPNTSSSPGPWPNRRRRTRSRSNGSTGDSLTEQAEGGVMAGYEHAPCTGSRSNRDTDRRAIRPDTTDWSTAAPMPTTAADPVPSSHGGVSVDFAGTDPHRERTRSRPSPASLAASAATYLAECERLYAERCHRRPRRRDCKAGRPEAPTSGRPFPSIFPGSNP